MMEAAGQHNVDADEIAKFSQIADKWWDKNGEFKPLHDINPLRLGYIDSFAQLAGKRVLDVGCGGGILSESMAKRGAAHVTGIDMAEKSLQTAQAHAAAEGVDNIDYRCIRCRRPRCRTTAQLQCCNLYGNDGTRPDPAAIVKACSELVKPDGMVFFSTINRNPKSYLHLIVGAEYVLNLVPKGTHDWQNSSRRRTGADVQTGRVGCYQY